MSVGDGDLPDYAPLPDGARDVLPVESAELSGIETTLREAFNRFGYREVRTPLIEFADVMDRAQEGGIGRAFRLFDDQGRVLVVRPDLTIPVARLMAGRLPDHPGPLRVSYIASVLRPAPVGRARRAEERQAGLELVGLPGPAADAEVIGVLIGALREVGVGDLRVALGDVSLTQAVLEGLGVAGPDQDRLRAAVRARNLVAWRRAAAALPLDAGQRDLIATLPARRGGVEVLHALAEQAPAAAAACEALAATLGVLDGHGVGDAVMIDLGVLRDWGYYSGIVFEGYASGVGRPVAVGGRYDELIGRFGAARPAVGVGVLLDPLHEALAARRGADALADGVVVAGGTESGLATAQALRATGMAAIGAPADPGAAARLAEADRWRYLALPTADGYRVSDRSTGQEIDCTDIVEGLRSLRS